MSDRSSLPFSVPLSSFSAVAVTTTDWFLAVGHDAAIERGFVIFDQNDASRGTMQVSIVQNLGDGRIVEVAAPTTITKASTEPVELEVQTTAIEPHRPIYLRIKTMPEGGSTPFWAVAATLAGTLHFFNPDVD